MIETLVEYFDTSTTLVFVAVLFITVLYLRRNKNLPPGPRGLPIIGSILSVDQNLSKEALKISKQYDSDVITIHLGPIVAIFLNSYDAIKDGLCSDDFKDRPDMIFYKKYMNDGKGIVSSDGLFWREQRRFTLSVLRDFGMGKMAAEEKIMNEIQYLLAAVKEKGSSKFDISSMLTTSAANVICHTIFGRRYSYDDKEFIYHTSLIQENFQIFGPTNPLTVIPALRHLPGDFFQYKQGMSNMRRVQDFMNKHIREHREKFDPDRIEDFLDAYLLEKQRQDARNPDNTFTDSQLLWTMLDLYAAGTDTSATTSLWGLYYLISYPEIQKKVQQELDDVIGVEREPNMMDKRHLPYTEATILEIHRLASIAAAGVPHANNTRDVIFRGYTIPKGSFIFTNIWAVHRDPKMWKYPEGFHPENFLNEKGDVVIPKAWMPFAIGRRQCPGEGLGQMEVFLVLTSLLQKLFFSIPEGNSRPDLEGNFGIVLAPKKFELCVTPRC